MAVLYLAITAAAAKLATYFLLPIVSSHIAYFISCHCLHLT
jgi:hypothetical protein